MKNLLFVYCLILFATNLQCAYAEQNRVDSAMLTDSILSVLYSAQKDSANKTADQIRINRQKKFLENINDLLAQLKIAEEKGDKKQQSILLGNIQMNYMEEGYYTKALECNSKKIAIDKELGNKKNLANDLDNLGSIYLNQAEFLRHTSGAQSDSLTSLALQQKLEALILAKKINDTLQMAFSLHGIGTCYLYLNDLKQAESYWQEAIIVDSIVGPLGLTLSSETNKRLSELYVLKKDWKQAFEHYKTYNIQHDSIFNFEESLKYTRFSTKYEYDQKEATRKAEQDKKDAVRRIEMTALGSGLFVTLIFTIVFFQQRNKIRKGKKRSDELLLNILPTETAEELKLTGKAQAKSFDEVTVMFTDFKNFTLASEQMLPAELVQEINYCYSEFDKIISKHKIEKIKTMGDSYMAAGGLPVANKTNPIDSVNAALEIQSFMAELKAQRAKENKP